MGGLTANPIFQQLQDPSGNLAEVTPADAVDFAQPTVALQIGTGGALRVLDEDGNDVTMAVVDGQLLPIRVTRVFATNTTAADITALFQ